MNIEEEYYNSIKTPNMLPFSEAQEWQRELLRKSFGFASFRLNKAWRELILVVARTLKIKK